MSALCAPPAALYRSIAFLRCRWKAGITTGQIVLVFFLFPFHFRVSFLCFAFTLLCFPCRLQMKETVITASVHDDAKLVVHEVVRYAARGIEPRSHVLDVFVCGRRGVPRSPWIGGGRRTRFGRSAVWHGRCSPRKHAHPRPHPQPHAVDG